MASSHKSMQMLVTRFERLSRRISLAGFLSGHKAEEAISAGRVEVDGTVATTNFKVFSEASVTLDGNPVSAPLPRPKLWGLRKPRRVLCESLQGEREGVVTIRSLMRSWILEEREFLGNAQTLGLEEEGLADKHFVVACGLPFAADGVVLLTNDGLFAENLASAESRILSEYDVKIAGDPPVDLLHTWRKRGARAGGLNFGQVYCSITKRSPVACWVRFRYVESPERPLELLLEKAKLKVHRLRRYAFGPYVSTALPEGRLVPLAVHHSLLPLIPVADMRQVLVPSRGGLVSNDGRIQSVSSSRALEQSAVLNRP